MLQADLLLSMTPMRPQVRYRADIISLSTANERIGLLRQMFNLTDWLEGYSNDHDEDTQNQIEDIGHIISIAESKYDLSTFRPSEQSSPSPTSKKGARMDAEYEDSLQLARHGYVVIPEEYPDDNGFDWDIFLKV
jgi:hypothetical protein